MPSESELVDIACELRHETAKAFLLFDGTKEVWVPKSMVDKNDDNTFTMPEWLAHREGLI